MFSYKPTIWGYPHFQETSIYIDIHTYISTSLQGDQTPQRCRNAVLFRPLRTPCLERDVEWKAKSFRRDETGDVIRSLWGFRKWWYPKMDGLQGKVPFIDDLGVPLFQETSICTHVFVIESTRTDTYMSNKKRCTYKNVCCMHMYMYLYIYIHYMDVCVCILYIPQFGHSDSPGCWALLKWGISQFLSRLLQTRSNMIAPYFTSQQSWDRWHSHRDVANINGQQGCC